MSDAIETPIQESPVAEAPESPAEAVAAVADAKTPAEKAIAEKNLRKFKLKVNGEEFEEELDLNDEKELTKRFQLAKAAQRSMNEKANMEKGLAQLIDLIKSDPARVLSHPDIGVDVKAFAQQILQQQLEEEQKSPEQREKEKLEAELKELREKYENEKKQKEQDEFIRLQNEQEEKLSNDIIGALETVKLPNSPRAVKYMAEYMAMALEQGIDVSAADIAPLVKQKMVDEYKEMMRIAPDEILEQFIDKDTETRLQKRRVSKMKQPPKDNVANIKQSAGPKPESKEPVKKKTISEFLNS